MPVNLSRLRNWLNTSGLLAQNSALYQLINALIDQIDAIQKTINTINAGGGSSGGGDANATYITETVEAASLPNSRQAIAGTNVAFNTSVANEFEIRSTTWSVLTNGDPVTPELVWDSDGDVIMTELL